MEAFEIYGGRQNLWQWELGQKVRVNCECDTVVFECQQLKDAPVVEPYELDGQRVADIPNCLLVYPGWIRVFGRSGDGEEQRLDAVTRITVLPAAKPQDYIYTEVEIRSWERLADRVQALEDGVIIWRDADGTVHPLPAEFMPKNLIYELITRNLYIGGDMDPVTREWSPTAGSGKSRLAVSGTLELHGKVEAEDSHFYMKLLDVLSEMKVAGTATFKNEVKMLAGLKVTSQVEAEGAKLKGTLDMKQNDVKNVQSLEVEGTSDLKGDVKVVPNTNRTDYVKLSDALNEALGFDFKNRVQLEGKDVAAKRNAMGLKVKNFKNDLIAAVSLVKETSASVISMPATNGNPYVYDFYDEPIELTKSITFLGCEKNPTEIIFRYNGTAENATVFKAANPDMQVCFRNVSITAHDANGADVVLLDSTGTDFVLNIEDSDFSQVDDIKVANAKEIRIVRSIMHHESVITGDAESFVAESGELVRFDGHHLGFFSDKYTGFYAKNIGWNCYATGGSCAEGRDTSAGGVGCHAEGQATKATGHCAHAEGRGTIANAMDSHAEGFWTTADSPRQHVQGKYNAVDADGKYAHIVGNGSSDTERSNAHTLDWAGNAWYAGTVEATGAILQSPGGSKFQVKVDDTGALGRVEKIVLTHDGNNEGKTMYGNFARIADPIDPSNIISATVMYYGNELVATGDMIVAEWVGNEFITLTAGSLTAGIIFPADFVNDSGEIITPAGLYALSSTEGYVSRVEYEAICPFRPELIPLVIDLDAYSGNLRDDATSMTLGMAILQLLSAGGGSQYIDNVERFWDDVSTNKPVSLLVHYGEYGTFEIPSAIRFRLADGVVAQIAYSALNYSPDAGVIDMKICLTRAMATTVLVNVSVS